MKPLKLLVVIVTYNGRRWLDRCLGSVRTWKPDGSALSAVDLFVVDNASTDGSADFVASEFPEAILVRNDRNQSRHEVFGHGDAKRLVPLGMDRVCPGREERLLVLPVKCARQHYPGFLRRYST